MKQIIITIFILLVFVNVCLAQGIMPDGQGTEASPYLISDLQHLNYISWDSDMWSGKYFIQTQDIDASETATWQNNGFKPFGRVTLENGGHPPSDYYEYTPFSSYYDGDGYSISNLYINRPTERCVGFCSNLQY